jgi:type I restriction-modification system DNA methylase subunit
MARTKTAAATPSTAAIGFEAKLSLAADKLRNNVDAAEYKHVVLGRTRRLAIMNLAIRGIETDIGKEHADTFRRDLNSQPHRIPVAPVGQFIQRTTFQIN